MGGFPAVEASFDGGFVGALGDDDQGVFGCAFSSGFAGISGAETLHGS